MATEGPRFPGTTATLANAGTSENSDAWVNHANIVSDNGTEAQITAATYDSPDISQLLVASNFGFTIPDGSTILGITVEIDRRDFAGAASDNRVQLATSTTFGSLVGDNKADTALDWPSTSTIKTYGGTSDTWNASLTPAQLRDSGFSVMLSVQADAANTDIGVDFIRVTVTYTPPNATGTGAVSVDEAALASSGTVLNPITGTGAVAADEAVLAASGAETMTGTAAVTVDEAVVAASGAETITGTGAVAADEAVLAATGSQDDSGVTGTGAISAGESGISGSGLLIFSGSGAVTIDEVTLAASGVETLSGSGAVSVDEPVLAASGAELFSGSGAVAVDEIVLSGSGLIPQPVTGTGVISADESGISGTGELPIAIAGSALERPHNWYLRRRCGLRRVG